MAQNKTGPIIGLAIFVVLSIGFAVAWYMTNTEREALAAKLNESERTASERTTDVKDLSAQLTELQRLVGIQDPKVSDDLADFKTDLEKTAQANIAQWARPETQAGANSGTWLDALRNTGVESDRYNHAAVQRKQNLDAAQARFTNDLKNKDDKISTLETAKEALNNRVVAIEQEHDEEMKRLEAINDERNAEIRELKQKYSDLENESRARIEDLESERDEYRLSVVNLRSRLRDRQDLTFFTPDGMVDTVDHVRELCYLNIGSADGLQVGVSFSVYRKDNSGVGRARTEDIKGKIEVVRILGPHRAEAKILDEQLGSPIAELDPVFNPVFQSGQALEIAVVGAVRLDGLSRAEFHRQVQRSGSKVSVQVDDKGEFLDGRGQIITEDEARTLISARTRFIVIADLGDQSTANAELKDLYRQINENADVLRKEAEKRGIYEVGLSTYLEHIGYKRRQIAWTPESADGFPAVLPNGAHSRAVGARGAKRESSAVISGKFSKRRTPTSSSTGAISGLFKK